MSEESFTNASHLSVAMTTTDADDVQTTGKATVPSSLSRGTEFYFQCAVIVIGVVGAAANALIIYAMIASKQHKKQLLIFNQNLCDLSCCLLLVVTYAMKLSFSNIPLTGTPGYWLCMIILSENLLWCSIDASVINLTCVTVERYLKVVYPTWAKKLLRKRAIYTTMGFVWICSITYNMALVFTTSGVVDGVCNDTILWSSQVASFIFNIWYFVYYVAIVVVITFLCYWHILVVIRRQARVMAGHSRSGSSSTQTQLHQIQSNVIKTMILVSAFYIIAWMPVRLYYVLLLVNAKSVFIASVYYLTTFVGFLYICANPFIYATKFDPVKRILVGLIPCKRSQQNGESIDMSGPRTVPVH